MPRPSMMPPAAITGMDKACTHCATSGSVPTMLAAKSANDGAAPVAPGWVGVRNVPRCPPASMPDAQTASAPTAAQACASASVVAVPIT